MGDRQKRRVLIERNGQGFFIFTSKRQQDYINRSNHLQDECNNLSKCSNFTEYHARSIVNQLKYLLQDPIQGLQSNHHHTTRIRTILSIYTKLLNLSPIEFHLTPQKVDQSMRNCNILDCRLHILHYIENLKGYCDSINTLRVILKSSTMISVMRAYEKICESIGRCEDPGSTGQGMAIMSLDLTV